MFQDPFTLVEGGNDDKQHDKRDQHNFRASSEEFPLICLKIWEYISSLIQYVKRVTEHKLLYLK